MKNAPAKPRPGGASPSAHHAHRAALAAVIVWASVGCSRTTTPGQPPAKAPPSASASAPASASPTSSVPASAAAGGIQGEGTADQLTRLDAGNTAFAGGDRAAALSHFRAAMQGPVTGAWISAGLAAAALLEIDAPAEAGAIYARLEAAAPIPEVHFAAGRYHGAQGDAPRARAALERAIDLEPDFLPAYPLLAGLLVHAGAETQAATLMVTYEQRVQRNVRRLADPALAMGERLAIIELFSVVDDERSVRALIDRLGDPHPELRTAAAGALIDLGEPEAVSALAKAALAETNPIAKELMTTALRRARDLLRRTQ